MRLLIFLTCFLFAQGVVSEEVISRDWISRNCNNPERLSPKCFQVFGKNDDVTTSFESVWTPGSLYPWPTTTFTAVLSSSDAADVGQSIVIEGLDENRDMASVTATLNGQTTVVVDGTWWRVYRVYNDSDDQNSFAGTVIIAQDGITTWSAGIPLVTTSVVATAISTSQQSLMSVFTTARNQYAYLYDARVTSDNSQGSECWLFVRKWGKTFRAISDTYITQDEGFIVDSYRIPRVIGPETDIDVRCKAIGGNSRISVTYGLYTELR